MACNVSKLVKVYGRYYKFTVQLKVYAPLTDSKRSFPENVLDSKVHGSLSPIVHNFVLMTKRILSGPYTFHQTVRSRVDALLLTLA